MSKLNTEIINYYNNFYCTKGRLPERTIPCTNSICNHQTKLTGDDLHKRIMRFGGVKELLSKFRCKNCR